MGRQTRSFTVLVATAVLAALCGPTAAADGEAASRPAAVDATSLGFAGYRELVPASSSSQTAVTVAPTGTCSSTNVSVGMGAEQKGSGGLLGARVYSQCLSGVQVIAGVFETTGGPVPMSTIGALAPGDVVAIRISTTAGVTTVNVVGPFGSDSMSVPDIVSGGYRVGAWPLFANHATATMPNFGTLKIYKNVLNSVPLGSTPWTKVHLISSTFVPRVKTLPFNTFGDVFRLKWLSP